MLVALFQQDVLNYLFTVWAVLFWLTEVNPLASAPQEQLWV